MTDDVNKFSTAVASGLSSFLSRKYNLDNLMFSALSTIITLVVTFLLVDVTSIIKSIYMEGIHINTYYFYTFSSIIGLSVLIYLLRDKIKLKYRLYYADKYQHLEIVGQPMINQLVEYMSYYKQFYRFSGQLVVEDNVIQFQKMLDDIYFEDKNYCINGIIKFMPPEFKNKKTLVRDSAPKPATPPPATPTPAPAAASTPAPTTAPAQPPPSATTTSMHESDTVKKLPPKVCLYWCYTTNRETCSGVCDYIDRIMAHKYPENSDISRYHKITISGYNFAIMKKYINHNYKFYHFEVISNKVDGMTSTDIFFPTDVLVRFTDTIFNVNGFIKWSHVNNGTITLTKCQLSENVTIQDYFQNVASWVEQNKYEGGYAIQYEVDKTFERDVVRTMYEGVIHPMRVLEDTYIHTLFHKDIATIWERVKTIHYHPETIINEGQSPRINMLLHGPPGTGKSTFAYRIAMATGRHILNIKISKYKKDDLFDVFTRPKIKGQLYNPKDVVFVLDEFDTDIDKVLLRQVGQEEQLSTVKNIMTGIFHTDTHPTINVVTDKSDLLNTEKVVSTTLQKVVTDVTEKINKTDEMITGLNKIYDRMNTIERSIVTLQDLLTVFQGAVPINGCIIIAMTNKYEELKDKCPAMFRAGRLTPIYFGNFDSNMINNVSNHYFNQSIKFNKPQDIQLQPSKVMDIVVEARRMNSTTDAYEHFRNKINELVTH